MNKQKGITLIGLVITIIVLLILAAISIATLTGENGILSKAMKASEEQKIKTAEEKLKLAIAEYQLEMKKVSLYSILNKIEGLESIDPDDEQAGLPYQVIVDGYEFLITDERGTIEIIYLGENKGIVPEIININKKVIGSGNIKLEIQAKTEDKEGLEKIILLKKSTKSEEKEVTGKNVIEEFNVTENGIYTIIVIGKNKRRVISSPIEITEMEGLSTTIQAGTVINGSTLITITANSEKIGINKIEIYEKDIKLQEITYKEPKMEIEEIYQVEYIPFFEEKTYYAKITTNSETLTDKVRSKNVDTIKTEDDLKKLATVVNNGEEATQFYGKTLKQIQEITLKENHTSIGTENKPFKGIYDGRGMIVNNLKIDNSDNFQGMFGYIENATLKNITLGLGSISGGNRIGGVVGYAKESKLQNLENQETGVSSKSNYIEKGINTHTIETTIIYDWEHFASSTGGICGKAENSDIQDCKNYVSNIGSFTGTYVGGIVGYAKSDKKSQIINCRNEGNILSEHDFVGGIVGISYGYVEIEKSSNNGKITSEKNVCSGIAGCIIGGIIKECNNTQPITGGIFVGGICGYTTNNSISNYTMIENCKNFATINSSPTEEELKVYYQQGNLNKYNTFYVGGLVGFANRAIIDKCSNEGQIVTRNNFINSYIYGSGGICGEIRDGKIQNCYNKANIAYNEKMACVGGIVGISYYNSYINNCYNTGEISGYNQIGGIVGQGTQTNIQYCYNKGNVKGGFNIGGIAGSLYDFKSEDYTNNYLYYCYNIGSVSGTENVGTINGYFNYYDIDYIYSTTNSNYTVWGNVNNYINATNQSVFNTKEEVMNKLLSENGNNFKNDYSGNGKINEGYPILNWQ